MQKLKLFLFFTLLFAGVEISAQITSYVGASISPGISKIRQPEASNSHSYGGGITYVLWEFPEWYLKSGLEFYSRTSSIEEIPKYFSVPSSEVFVPVEMKYQQFNMVIPIQAFFPVWHKKENGILLFAGMEVMYTIQEKYIHEVYGNSILNGEDVKKPVKTGITAGFGYQRQFSDILYFNIYPSVNLDIKADKPFTSFELTLEMIYGVY